MAAAYGAEGEQKLSNHEERLDSTTANTLKRKDA
jgi:hypothetical protein